jgi:hypothetical protein
MRKLQTILRLTLPLSLGALVLGGAGCSRFTGSGDDSQPTASPAPPARSAPAATATATATATVLAPGVYTVNKQLETDPSGMLTTVTIEEDATKLELSFKNDQAQAGLFSLAKPGSRDAMFLEQPDGKKIALRSSSGVALLPAKTTVPPGGSLKFTAVFGPLDPGVRKFSLFEGESAKTAMPGDTTYWVLHDIEIK